MQFSAGKYFWILLASIFFGLGCRSELPPEPVAENSVSKQNLFPVELALNWFPEIEHGGYYTALINGYYEQEGLKVTILPGGPDAPVMQRLGAKRVQFGVANADNVVFARNSGVPVTSLFAPIQHSPRCLLVHADSLINKFEDLKDITLAMNDSNAFAQYIRYKIPLTNVQVVRYTGSVALFLENQHMVQQGYNFSEPVIAAKKGVRTRLLMLSDLGFDPYTSLLVTHQEIIKDQPELVRKFVHASQKGWQEYLKSPAETNKYIHELNPEVDLDMLAAGIAELTPLCQQQEQTKTYGEMTESRWNTLVNQMHESKVIEQATIPLEKLMTNQFLKQATDEAVPTQVTEP